MKFGTPQELTSDNIDKVEMSYKVEKDIAFLKDRIQRMKEARTPNTSGIQTYTSLLESRIMVLDWLQEQDQVNAEPTAQAIGF